VYFRWNIDLHFRQLQCNQQLSYSSLYLAVHTTLHLLQIPTHIGTPACLVYLAPDLDQSMTTHMTLREPNILVCYFEPLTSRFSSTPLTTIAPTTPAAHIQILKQTPRLSRPLLLLSTSHGKTITAMEFPDTPIAQSSSKSAEDEVSTVTSKELSSAERSLLAKFTDM